ncbi:hypothetical protein ACEPAG_8849 [Sanghuangporus baumii]
MGPGSSTMEDRNNFCSPDAHWLMSYRTIRQFNFALHGLAQLAPLGRPLWASSTISSSEIIGPARYRFLIIFTTRRGCVTESHGFQGLLRYFVAAHPTSTISGPLIRFVRIHERLRRFDMSFCGVLQFGPTAAEEDNTWFMELLKVICTLEHLQVLGITFPKLEASEVSQAINMLNEHAHSLESCNAVRIEGTQNVGFEVIMAKLGSCKFLALSDMIHCNCLCISVRPPLLTVEDLVYRHGLTKLEQTILFGWSSDYVE